jgi:hypothetical protein
MAWRVKGGGECSAHRIPDTSYALCGVAITSETSKLSFAQAARESRANSARLAIWAVMRSNIFRPAILKLMALHVGSALSKAFSAYALRKSGPFPFLDIDFCVKTGSQLT